MYRNPKHLFFLHMPRACPVRSNALEERVAKKCYNATMKYPALVAHADWSTAPGKRWVAVANRGMDGHYTLHAPTLAGDPSTWLHWLNDAAGGGGVLLGVDFPIGLPLVYASRAGITSFPDLLPHLGTGEWADFYRPAETAREISLGRPFYPFRPGGTRQQHLLNGLGMTRIDDLRRACDRGYARRRPAAPLFWTMGAQQVGKAAIAGWRDVLGPALREREDVYLWPFAGSLSELLARGGIVIAESYPAEFYTHLGISFPKGPDGSGGKRVTHSRKANAELLFAWAAANQVQLKFELKDALRSGFGPTAAGEDPFDAVAGLVGMLNVLFGHRLPGEPADDQIRRIEGWILGQAAAA